MVWEESAPGKGGEENARAVGLSERGWGWDSDRGFSP